ncbi:MAG TPA: glycosyltransferase family 2 protein [Candidatus Glassbacteria bacterium]|nr:glycosyltransferase family 2 protein [Candidatus Glassbacteria bacterium]
MDCSVIFTSANEYPKICYAVQSVINELDGYCDYEIAMVDNCSTDKTQDHFSRLKNRKVKYMRYDDKQSHWCAKSYGVAHTTGKYVFFLDSHAVIGRDSIRNMMEFLDKKEAAGEKVGAVHCYHNAIMMYQPKEYELKFGKLAYRFMTGQNILLGKTEDPYQIGVATTDGMMVPRKVFEDLGTWHPEFGVRAGGEAYMNFKHSTCGYPHYMHPKANFYHFKERGYKYVHPYSDWARNNFICGYVCGGEEWLDNVYKTYVGRRKITKETGDAFRADVMEKCKEEMEFIKSRQEISLTDYFNKWETQPLLAAERKAKLM